MQRVSLHLARGLINCLQNGRGRRHGHIGALESLSRIREVNPRLKAVVGETLSSAEASAAAAAAAAASEKGPLAGVALLVKDALDVRGFPTSSGLEENFRGPAAEENAVVVARLRRAGAVPVGKTNVPPHCLDVQTYNAWFGTTVNPYDPSLTPGGSSGGSAVAVAAGMVSMAVGSDLQGSLRIPAALCGVWSLKPSLGRIPTTGHRPEGCLLQNTLTVGAVADGPDALDHFMAAACEPPSDEDGAGGLEPGVPGPPCPYRPRPPPPLHDVRVFLTPRLAGAPTQRVISEALEAFGRDLEAAGAEVIRAGPPLDDRNLFRCQKLVAELFTSIVPADHPLSRPPGDLSPSASRLHAGEMVQRRGRQQLEAFLMPGVRRHAVWVLPACGTVAFPHNPDHGPVAIDGQDYPYWQPLLAYSFQAAATGHPAVVMPIGMAGHVPVGCQVVGRIWKDEELVAVCRAMAAAVTSRVPPPPIRATGA